jgi:hypothetical protein
MRNLRYGGRSDIESRGFWLNKFDTIFAKTEHCKDQQERSQFRA